MRKTCIQWCCCWWKKKNTLAQLIYFYDILFFFLIHSSSQQTIYRGNIWEIPTLFFFSSLFFLSFLFIFFFLPWVQKLYFYCYVCYVCITIGKTATYGICVYALTRGEEYIASALFKYHKVIIKERRRSGKKVE